MVQKCGVHQLRLVVYPIIYRVLYIPGGAGFLPSTVALMLFLFTGRFFLKKFLPVNLITIHST